MNELLNLENVQADVERLYEEACNYVISSLNKDTTPEKRKLFINGILNLNFCSEYRMNKTLEDWIDEHPDMSYEKLTDAIVFDKRTYKSMLKLWMTDEGFAYVNKGNINHPWLIEALSACVNAGNYYEKIKKDIKVWLYMSICALVLFCFYYFTHKNQNMFCFIKRERK